MHDNSLMDLHKTLLALLEEYDARSCGPSPNEPEVIKKVRHYLASSKMSVTFH